MRVEVEVMPSKDQFAEKHKPATGHKVIVGGTEKYRWVCTCGATRDLPVNSGLWLGVKIQWEKHYKEIMGA